MNLIRQALPFRTLGDKCFHIFQLIGTASFKPLRLVENESGVAAKDHLVFDVMDSALDWLG